MEEREEQKWQVGPRSSARCTDLFQAAQQVLPLFELQDADDNLVSRSFGDLLLEEESFESNTRSLLSTL